jgi:hypothetical protein
VRQITIGLIVVCGLGAVSFPEAVRAADGTRAAVGDEIPTVVDALRLLRIVVGLEPPEHPYCASTGATGGLHGLDRRTLLWTLEPREEPPADPLPLSYAEIIRSLPLDMAYALAQEPDASGALDRNQSSYFHVRFQTGVRQLGDRLLASGGDPVSAELLVRAIEYAFLHQNPDGSFALEVPDDVDGSEFKPADLASGTAFFLASLGTALMGVQQSEWLATAAEARPFADRIDVLRGAFRDALDYLVREQPLLESYDASASNRRMLDALAFYLMGRYLGDDAAVSDGLRILEDVIETQADEGYFPEQDGFDSSYNGVSLRAGVVFLAFLPDDDELRPLLWDGVLRAARWQASRVEQNGEISTDGNTRVYDGGESFLGSEKGVAWTDAALAFHMLYALSRNPGHLGFADKIVAFYR